MIRVLLISSCVVLSLVAAGAAEDGAKSDREKLQGKWKCIYSETSGKGFEPVNETFLIFEKDSWNGEAGGEWATKGTFKLDSSRKPKAIDFTITENKLIPESKGTKACCIYELEGDRLKIRTPDGLVCCWYRPKEFATKGGTTGNLLKDILQGGSLEIYKKVNP
jgi:uncharacterized protein (TIGR03067 family)